jgi:hypothetical protein
VNPAAQQDASAKSHGDREERAWHGLDSGKQETNSLEISYDLCRSGTISNCLGQGLVRGGQPIVWPQNHRNYSVNKRDYYWVRVLKVAVCKIMEAG